MFMCFGGVALEGGLQGGGLIFVSHILSEFGLLLLVSTILQYHFFGKCNTASVYKWFTHFLC